ncbi:MULTISPECIES: type I methionyl aminopeptidase [Pseudothermotoga]|uniref:Methionine aminopeptidase n=3 Tax=Pseudothermotoga TaxID=1643951 RepID=A8F4T3_PSELT|nr:MULTISPECIES: type I methionyl aminopeptidase [Pseudothermotoga]ABV33167.1 methionine aminopeptidase, type I [Pseudothermotoga lettingae TMO]HBJ81697.1 type I methionyl aminopeptidase [Pseudothermotoga sp.]HBT26371.1 type I methionyl aminopeptidase [Pseudothermotoga sp.]
MIRLKSSLELEYMKKACQAVGIVLKELGKIIKEGVTAKNVEEYVLKRFDELGVKPAFKGYRGYQYATCVSVNEEVLHGSPLERKVFKQGDLVSIDLGAIYEGYYGDGAITYCVGFADNVAQKLLCVGKEALEKAIGIVRNGVRVGDISYAIQSYVEANGFNVIRDYVGHGIGRNLHEEPEIPNYGKPGTGALIMDKMTIAIEVMVCEGDWQVSVLNDGWTVVMVDGKRSVHFEHTVLVTKDGAEVLTKF